MASPQCAYFNVVPDSFLRQNICHAGCSDVASLRSLFSDFSSEYSSVKNIYHIGYIDMVSLQCVFYGVALG